MNIWTQKSIWLANQTDYLDQLYKIYPMANNLKRDVDISTQKDLALFMDEKNNEKIVSLLLNQKVFPIKDSYVAYLKRNKDAIAKNPQTINRLAGMLYELGYDGILKLLSSPIETNRQIGPLFRNWLERKSLGIDTCTDENTFLSTQSDLILVGSDSLLKQTASIHFGYTHDKGLDFICRVNKKIILGEAKFLTDFGGHQNSQFADAMNTIKSNIISTKYDVKPVAILDGVLYIPGNSKLHRAIQEDVTVLSALLLRDYLYSL